MKGLKILLGAIYIILILLLLLPCKCCRKEASEPEVDDEGVVLPPVTERFAADVVMCIDATGSMGSIIETVKSNALNFYPDLKQAARRLGKDITGMRIRVIAFRDYDYMPLNSSDFFSMPDDDENFRRYVSDIQPIGGGTDIGELGLDAIKEAVTGSDWSDSPRTKRVILLWTDDVAKQLSSPAEFENIARKWNSFGPAKKMILFTGENVVEPTYAVPWLSWSHIESKFADAVRYANGGTGLSDLDYEEILRNISEDI